MNLAPKSIPNIEAIPATKAANTAAYLHMQKKTIKSNTKDK